ncbi:MAG: hypothetical protein SF029_11675 [bacterium]|nr:hypothetical protein [bacterium]
MKRTSRHFFAALLITLLVFTSVFSTFAQETLPNGAPVRTQGDPQLAAQAAALVGSDSAGTAAAADAGSVPSFEARDLPPALADQQYTFFNERYYWTNNGSSTINGVYVWHAFETTSPPTEEVYVYSVRTSQGYCTIYASDFFECVLGRMLPNQRIEIEYTLVYSVDLVTYSMDTYAYGSYIDTDSLYVAPRLISPLDTITTGYGNPLYDWGTRPTATSYEIAVFRRSDGALIYYSGALSSGITDIEPTTEPFYNENARLYNGQYSVYTHYKGTEDNDQGEWSGPWLFTLNAAPPAPATVNAALDTDTARPRMRFTLNGTASNASYFRVLLWRTTGGPFLVDYVFSRSQLCNTFTSTSCGLDLWFDLQDNRSYYFAVLSIGPGGWPTSGGQAGNGWGYTEFNFNIPAPPTPTNVTAVRSGNNVILSWDDSDLASTYYAAWFYGNQYIGLFTGPRTTSLCNGTRCSAAFSLTNAPNGTYSAYVSASGPGGNSTGGQYNGWGGPGTFSLTDLLPIDPALAEAPGYPIPGIENIVLNPTLPTPGESANAPALVTNLSGAINSTDVVVTFSVAEGATDYVIWVGTANAEVTYASQTFAADALGCADDGVCSATITLPAPLPSGSQFYVAVQSSGPGGLSTGGLVGNGYAVSDVITVP